MNIQRLGYLTSIILRSKIELIFQIKSWSRLLSSISLNNSPHLIGLVFWLVASTMNLSACGFHLRNQNSLPPALQQLEVVSNKPYEPFIKQLKRELALLKTQPKPHQQRTQLIIHKHKLSYRMPIIGSSQQARIYSYTFYLEYSLKYHDNLLIKKKSIMINRLLTLNENVLLTTNNQLDLLTIDIQQAAILQLINELKAFSSVSSYNQHQTDRVKDLPPDMDSESPLMPYEGGNENS